jgi:hypothetical protein
MPPAHAAVGCDVKGNVMTSRPGTIRMRGSATATRAAVGACTLFLVFSALAQEAQSPKSTPVPGPNPAQSPNGPGFFLLPPLPPQPNLVETFGRWLDQGTTKFRTDMQGAQETFDKLGNQTRDAAKDATDAMIGLPNTRIVTARERCGAARNGSPDCQAAVDAFCRGKGFQSGKSLDTQSELKCPAKVLLEGRSPNDAECRTEIFVTRAVCQ